MFNKIEMEEELTDYEGGVAIVTGKIGRAHV